MFPRFVAQAHGTLAIAAALLGGVAAAVRGDPIQACQDIQAQLSSESAVISDPCKQRPARQDPRGLRRAMEWPRDEVP